MPRKSSERAKVAPAQGVRAQEVRTATEPETRALASSLRLRILRLCIDEPLTNRQIAQALDKQPATVLHHVRRLVDTGYLEALAPRRGNRGAREIPYRSTGKSWYTRTGPAVENALLGAFLAELEQAPPEQVGMTRLALRLPSDERAEFRDRLAELFHEFAERDRDPQAEAWSVFFAIHPEPSRPR